MLLSTARLFARVAMLAVLLSPTSALADAAEDKFHSGRAAMDRHAYDEACALFEESLDLGAPVGALLNLAECEDKRGHVARSLALWNEGLGKLPTDDPRVALAKRSADDVSHRVGRITIVWSGAPPNARGYVDGQDATFGGPPVTVDPGVHKVSASSTSGAKSVEVTVAAGALETIDLGATTDTPLPKVAATGRGLLIGGATTLAVAGAAFIGAIASGVAYFDARDTLDARCPNRDRCTDPVGIDASETGRAAGAANIAMFVVGGVATAVGTTLLVVWSTKSAPATPAAALVVGPTGAAWVGRF